MKQLWVKVLIAVIAVLLLSAGLQLFTDVWISYAAAFCGVFISAVYLFFTDTEKGLNKADSIMLKAVVLILLSGLAFNSVLSYQAGKFQDQVLTSVKETVYSGIAQARIQQAMFEAYREYQSAEAGDLTVSEAFLQVHSPQLTNGNSFITEVQGDTAFADFSYEIISPDQVIMTAVINEIEGEISSYSNSNGMTGLQEYRAILNEAGVSYERIN